jgi:hypothetical protein
MFRRIAAFTVCLGAAAALGCSGGAASTDGAGLTSDDASFVDCSKVTEAKPYAPGTIEKSSSGQISVELVENQPGPATANNPPGTWVRGSNTWTIEVRDSADQPLGGLEIDAIPKMPVHNHGTSVTPLTREQGGGRYVISPLYLFMSGYWQVTLDVSPPASDAATSIGRNVVVFNVCIPS